jgi:hypothetical protein
MQDPIGEEDVEFAGDVEEVDPGGTYILPTSSFIMPD